MVIFYLKLLNCCDSVKIEILFFIIYNLISSSSTNKMLSIDNTNISVDNKTLIYNCNFTINKNDKIVLLGKNGSGKTTMFKFIIDKIDKSLYSIYLAEQELPPSKMNICNVVMGNKYDRKFELELKTELNETELIEYNNLVNENYEKDNAECCKILLGLGFKLNDLTRSMDEFSGGYRSRLSIAKALFLKPDILMLDEPTNHLDLKNIDWLEDFCCNYNKTLLVISHNISFVNNIANKILEIDNYKLYVYKCNYKNMLKQKELNYNSSLKAWNLLIKEINSLKSKGRSEQAEALLIKKANEGIVRPPIKYEPKFLLYDDNVVRKKKNTALIKLENVVLEYDKPVLNINSLALYNDKRIALVGDNGSGKTTLLKYIYNNYNKEYVISYFDQHFYHNLPENSTAVEYLSSYGNNQEVRRFLGTSGIESEVHNLEISKLSGGQKSRVYFAGVFMQNPDIILLDEPTNHLDIDTSMGLLKALENFKGSIICVSHDLYFLNKFKTTELWICKNNIVECYEFHNDDNILDYYD